MFSIAQHPGSLAGEPTSRRQEGDYPDPEQLEKSHPRKGEMCLVETTSGRIEGGIPEAIKATEEEEIIEFAAALLEKAGASAFLFLLRHFRYAA